MKKYIAIMTILLGLGAFNSVASAGETPRTVVELFTSQGCSSCPPANEFVGSIADNPDKLVLSYGVTYWDFLGWKDTFGNLEFTKRQKEYGSSLGIGHVYTPQIVLNGREHNSRYKRRDIEKSALTPTKGLTLDLSEQDGILALDSNAEEVLIVGYKPGWQEIDVKRGENGGRILRVANVVDHIQIVKNMGLTRIKVDPQLSYAALVHDRLSHQILAASVLKN